MHDGKDWAGAAGFLGAEVFGEPPALAHHAKWKEWLFRAGQDPNIDSVVVLGNVLEEFMDLSPESATPEFSEWQKKRGRVEAALEENGLRYFRFGRVLPQGSLPQDELTGHTDPVETQSC